jgi:hypothetical protein
MQYSGLRTRINDLGLGLVVDLSGLLWRKLNELVFIWINSFANFHSKAR